MRMSSDGAPSVAVVDETSTILAGQLFDSYTGQLVRNQLITVNQASGLILEVSTFKEEDVPHLLQETSSVHDLRHLTLLPGFVDVHVHLFLQPYAEVTWDDQVTRQSLAERAIRATVHAKRTIMAGYTSVRDLGTEGAGDADIALRASISGSNPLIPGPRYFTANRAIVATGAYGPRSHLNLDQDGVDGVTGAEVADGVEGCRKAVRRQIAAGADVIKVYADYRVRTRMGAAAFRTAAASTSTFSQEELMSIINTASQHGVKVAAHASVPRSVTKLLSLGWDSIEHATWDAFSTDDTYQGTRTIWVPTLSVFYITGGQRWEDARQSFKQAIASGFDRIATGGDTGPFPHGQNALEMQLMVQLGADWRKVLQWATLGGWKCIRSREWEGWQGEERLQRAENFVDGGQDVRIVGDNDVPFGAIKKGWAADIIAIEGDLEEDFHNAVAASSVQFVMKGGRIYKSKGQEVPWY